MTIELRPLGVGCNIQCQYCYQNPQRDAGNLARRYDLDAMKAALVNEGGDFSLFGGEPLLVPLADLEDLWAWGLTRAGKNGVQTNGTLITDDHIRLFKRYKVHVGISVDGPGELNDIRWAGTLTRTREATARTHEAIDRLCREGIPPSLIITLHRGNATPELLPRMHEWLRHLQAIGVTSARLHVLEVDSEPVRARWALSIEENVHAFRSFAALETELTSLRLDVFEDMRRLLRGQDDQTTCVWNACDPYTTRAVRGVEGHGQSSNCGRTNKDGIDFVKAAAEGFERYLALYHTPQEHGGCQGCRFFLMCKGQCPGTAIDGDWRNRTEHCALWMALFAQIEDQLRAAGEVPISRSPRRPQLEASMVEVWSRGQNTTMAGLLASAENRDAPSGQPQPGGHGDWHGDHTDAGAVEPGAAARQLPAPPPERV